MDKLKQLKAYKRIASEFDSGAIDHKAYLEQRDILLDAVNKGVLTSDNGPVDSETYLTIKKKGREAVNSIYGDSPPVKVKKAEGKPLDLDKEKFIEIGKQRAKDILR